MELAFKIVRIERFDVGLWLHTATNPADSEWNEVFRQLEQALNARVDPSLVRNFVVSDGGAPNTSQRNYMRQHLSGVHSTIVTNSLSNPVKRGIATAVTWMSRGHGFFAPADAQRALDHIGLSGSLDVLWAELLSLQQLMPINETLRLAAQALHRPAPVVPRAARVGT